MISLRAWIVALLAFSAGALAQDTRPGGARPGVEGPEPEPRPGLRYEADFFPGATYDPQVPTPAQILGQEVGTGGRPATPQEITACLDAWEGHPRIRIVEIGHTHQGRPLHAVFVSSAANLQRLDEIQSGWRQLADPRRLEEEEADDLSGTLPAVAWLGYSIHGNETTGADAAIQVLYHLLADTEESTVRLLDDLLIIVDPLMNPDGRQRYLSQLQDSRTRAQVVDDQDNQVAGDIPGGRTNHYLFDLNRDWIYGVQPESRVRLSYLRHWYPLIMVDAHEMGSQDTFLFSPGREPINPHIPASKIEQWKLFGEEQGKAFSGYGWRYYMGEWAEEWYPGYSSSWGSYRGAVGILYEQSHRGAVGVRRPEGFIATYREGVHQQALSSLANLETLHRHRDRLVSDFLEERRRNLAEDGPFADRVFILVPRGNAGREGQLAELLKLQGLELFVADEAFEIPAGQDRMGGSHEGREVPAGALVVPNRQPDAPLVSALMEFDTRFTHDFLTLERKSLLRDGSSLLYDVSAWALPMYLDVEAYEARMPLPDGLRPLGADESWPVAENRGGVDRPDARVAYIIDGADDRSVAAAARLMERGVEVNLALRPFKFGQRQFPRGSVVVSRQANQAFGGDWIEILDDVTRRLGVPAIGIDTGTGEALPEDEPDPVDLGGGFFQRLEPPRIAVFTRGPGSGYSAGEVWHAIDQRLGIRATYLNTSFSDYNDFRRYNVIVLPNLPQRVTAPMRDDLERWVRSGGTLIALGQSAAALTSGEEPLAATRQLQDVLGELEGYEQAVIRQVVAESATVDLEGLYRRGLPDAVEYPWLKPADPISQEELERRDAWQRIFAPTGVVLAGRVDERHWLTVGLAEPLPLLVEGGTVLMAGEGVEAPVRFGIIRGQAEASQPQEPATRPDANEAAPAREQAAPGPRPGWVQLPPGLEAEVRMSGLLWPEFAARIAHAPYVTRQGMGDGQVILIAERPAFRGATLGTMRLLNNAMIYGPGCGAGAPILP